MTQLSNIRSEASHLVYRVARRIGHHRTVIIAYVMLDETLGYLYRYLRYGRCGVYKDKIVFMTYRNTYECNPKYIAEKILERRLPYDLVWITPSANSDSDGGAFPERVRLVHRNSSQAFREMASAKVWIDNSLNFEWKRFPKKEEQVYFETWHGSMGLKRVGNDDVSNWRWTRTARRVGQITDYCISDSDFENQVFRGTFWPTTPILEYGHARNDLLMCTDIAKKKAIREKVYSGLGQSSTVHYMLYAPTFRDSGTLDCYDVNFPALVEALEKRFGGKWKVLFRLHFHNRRKSLPMTDDVVIDATAYPDMQELMVAADAGLTDYSSWCCDYVLTGKPCFIYAKDRANYDTERGLYYPLETTPFPIAETNSQLLDNVMRFDESRYRESCDRFLKDRGSFESGVAAEMIVDKIQEIIGDSGQAGEAS